MVNGVKVYHGTTSKHTISLSKGIDLSKSDRYTDFGLGFYVTKDRQQAERFARKMGKLHNDKELRKQQRNAGYRPNLVRGMLFSYSLDMAQLQRLPGCIFHEADDNWRRFVYNNRIDHNAYLPCEAEMNQQMPPKYHYVSGALADGKMAELQLVKEGLITVDSFLDTIVSIGEQISLHTNEAVNCLKEIGVKTC